MSAPEYEMQVALRTLLIADAGLTAIVGGTPAVFETVPSDKTGLTYPYMHLDYQEIGDDQACVTFSELVVTVHIWSNTGNKEEAWSIKNRVQAVLKTKPTLTGYTVKNWEFMSGRVYDDPEPSISHGIVEFRYEVETTS